MSARSSSARSRSTPSRAPGTRDDVLGGSPRTSPRRRPPHAGVSWSAWSATTSRRRTLAFLGARGVDLGGLERCRARPSAGRAATARPQRRADARHAAQRLRRLRAEAARARRRDSRVLFLGNIHPSLQLDVLEQAEKPRLVGAGHDELLDLRRSAQSCSSCCARRPPGGQRRGGAPARRRAQRAQGGARDPRDGPKTVIVKRGEYGALLFDERRPLLRRRPIRSRTSSIRPAPATPSPAASSACSTGWTRATRAALRQATVMGSTIASFTVEQFASTGCATWTWRRCGSGSTPSASSCTSTRCPRTWREPRRRSDVAAPRRGGAAARGGEKKRMFGFQALWAEGRIFALVWQRPHLAAAAGRRGGRRAVRHSRGQGADHRGGQGQPGQGSAGSTCPRPSMTTRTRCAAGRSGRTIWR